MTILHVERRVGDFEAWKRSGFDADPIGRAKEAVLRGGRSQLGGGGPGVRQSRLGGGDARGAPPALGGARRSRSKAQPRILELVEAEEV